MGPNSSVLVNPKVRGTAREALIGAACGGVCYPPLSLSRAATLAASTRTGLADRSGI